MSSVLLLIMPRHNRLLRKLKRLEDYQIEWEWYLPMSWCVTQERIWRLRERLGLPLNRYIIGR